MNLKKKAVFSNDGEFFAFVNEEGALKIWETSTNVLKQDHFLKSSVRFTISSIIWGPYTNEFNITDKSDEHDSGTEHSDCQCLVIGTTKGEILLYDFMIGKFYNHFIKAHKDVVTDLCWHTETSCLYSSSKDNSISMWDIAAGKIKLKWKTDEPVNSICVIDQDNLLSASSVVTWWNVKDQTIVKKFDCLHSEIHTVLPVLSTDVSSKSYFITIASDEPKISAWRLSEENNNKPVAAFNLSDEVLNIDVTRNISKCRPMTLSAVLKSGHLCIYQHVLNGRSKKNLAPLCSIQVVTKATSDKQQSSIPVIASKITSNLESCILAYGHFENPIFEKIKPTDCPKLLTITAKEEANISFNSDVEESTCNNKSYLSANGQLPTTSPLNSPKSSKHKESPRALSTEENSYHTDVKSSAHKTVISSSPTVKKKKQRKSKKLNSNLETINIELDLSNPTSVADCLLRSLETEDSALLSLVLQCSDEEIVKACVPKIPLYKIKYILTELYSRHKNISSKKERYSSRKWLKEIVNCHLSHIMEDKELMNALNRFRSYVEQQNVNETILKLSILKGLLRIHRIQSTSLEGSDSGQTDQKMET